MAPTGPDSSHDDAAASAAAEHSDLQVYTPALGALVADVTKPLTDRFRALFTLRNVGGKQAIDAIGSCFHDTSALFKHEAAYCLGQMQDPYANDILTRILRDEEQDVMVRHEAGEALGAIGSAESRPVLEEFAQSPVPEIAETCQIALDRLDWIASKAADPDAATNPYLSVDPAPSCGQAPVADLQKTLMDTSKPLFDRYRALFALRNRGDTESVEAICTGLKDGSALFRHEVAYVLGQMQHPASVDALKERLQDKLENEMVRHECAEALGAIATEECLPILKENLQDGQRVVQESCIVALDIHEYETSGNFQYADSIKQLVGESDK